MKKREKRKYNKELLELILKHRLSGATINPIQYLFKSVYDGNEPIEVSLFHHCEGDTNDIIINCRTHRFDNIETIVNAIKREAKLYKSRYITIGVCVSNLNYKKR